MHNSETVNIVGNMVGCLKVKNGKDVWIAASRALRVFTMWVLADDMTISPKINSGWAMDREKFSDKAKEVFNIAVNHRRQRLLLDSNAIRGSRFNDDIAVMARLESMFTEAEFMVNVGPCIDKALQDAGCSDWWYTYEKQYEDEYIENECEIDNDE